MNKVAFWLKNARSIALPQSVLPAALAIAVAAKHEGFSLWLALLALVGIIAAHLAMNLADDYFDFQTKTGEHRQEMASEGIRARIAKYDYLTSGKATIGQLRTAIVLFLLVAAVLGAVVFVFRGMPVVYIALATLFLGIEYSGKPLQLGYHGWGEWVIGIIFGPLLMAGMHIAASGVFTQEVLLTSIAVGLLVINIVYSHAVLDEPADEKCGKMTFSRLLKSKPAKLAFSYIFNLLPFVIVLGGVLAGILHWAYCLVLLVSPMAIYLVYSLTSFVYGREISLQPKKWMGPMGNWDGYCKAGIGWFMIRWLVCRNLVTFFSFILIVVNVILAFVI